MAACTDSVYELSNALIRPVLKTDTVNRTIEIQAKVLISNVEFDGYSAQDMTYLTHWANNIVEFKGLHFESDLIFNYCSGLFPAIMDTRLKGDLHIKNTVSNNHVSLLRVSTKGLHIENCTLNGYILLRKVSTNGNTIILNNQIENLYLIESKLNEGLTIEKCQIDQMLYLKQDTIHSQVVLRYIKAKDIYIPDCLFKYPADSATLEMFRVSYCVANEFTLSDCSFITSDKKKTFEFLSNSFRDVTSIYDCRIDPHLVLVNLYTTGRLVLGEHNQYGNYISLHNVSYNNASFFDWPSLQSNIIGHDWLTDKKNDRLYFGKTDEELANTMVYDRLVQNKQGIYNLYRTQGHRQYANEMLVEIRDLQTRMLKYRYEQNPNLEAYFFWKMNLFLKKFSAYGTNPVIAIIYSLKVILLFALFYLFLHNDWDIGNRRIVGKRLNFLLKYFQVEKGLSELDQEEQSGKQDDLKKLRLENEAGIGKTPSYLNRVIDWYIHSNLLSNKLRAFAIQKMDILSGTYAELSKPKQVKVAFLSGIWFCSFLAYTLLLKVLNAFTLSLNAFTTLGFGNIPTKGFSRYVVIVQGFIGWVLMTIFSVTLISQLIQ